VPFSIGESVQFSPAAYNSYLTALNDEGQWIPLDPMSALEVI
jgi:hypothetical protein